jgi:hypothetical protein
MSAVFPFTSYYFSTLTPVAAVGAVLAASGADSDVLLLESSSVLVIVKLERQAQRTCGRGNLRNSKDGMTTENESSERRRAGKAMTRFFQT